MYEITKRIENLLGSIEKEINSDAIVIHDIQIKKLDYFERDKCVDHTGFEKFIQGERFGEADQHYCFKTTLNFPENFIGKRVVLQLKTGATDIWNTDNPQFILYLDKQMLCALDMNHYECILTEEAQKREYEIILYAYTNTKQKDILLDLSVAVQYKEIQELYYDLSVPFETALLLKESDYIRTDILEVINKTLNLVDFRQVPSKDFYASILEAKKYFDINFYQNMSKENDVTVYSVGHTHIDVAWKWRVRQTREKVLRSFLTVLYLMDKYPEYKFMSSQPQLYEFVKEDAPEIYEKIKEKVKEGRWEVEGAMWLEADCNLTSGESLVRQIVYGKKFFKEEFGKDNVVLWLPDVFGYSAALPQILKKSGVKYFMTTKIGWNEYNKIPNDTFLWQGIDGSEILTYFITTRNFEKDPELKRLPDISTTYNGMQNPSQIMGTWQRYQNKELTKDVLTCYGYGDGGGGTTAKMLEMSKRMSRQIPGCPNVKQSFAREFFEKLEENLDGKQIPKWCGDLYLEFHRGTYTSMGRNKKNNRKMEFELGAAEFFQTIAKVKDKTFLYEKEKLDQGWKLIMLNQFHDILPGSSIKEVYEDSDIDYQKVRDITYSLQHQAMERIELVENSDDTVKKEKAIYVWNTLSFSRSELILLPKGIKHVIHRGNMLDMQYSEEGNYCFVENIQPKGYTVLYCIEEETQLSQAQLILEDKQSDISDVKSLETRFYKVAFNDAGEITELYDKAADRDVIKKTTPSNRLVVYEDRPSEYDAWNIDNYYTQKCYPVNNVVEWKVEAGELFTKVHCKKKFMDSYITQDILFYEDMEQIDFKTEVDWKQEQLLLKADFDIDVLTHQATCEIQYGNVVRNTHKNTSWEQAQFEVCAHKWVDVSEEGYGAALMNDCKYGYSFNESHVGITLIKSGIFPNPDADKEVHHFIYSLLPHEGDLREGHVIQQAYQLNVPCTLSDVLEVSAYQEDFTLFGNVEENVIIETLKKAEDTDDLIIRLYEAYGKRGNVSLNLNKLGVKNAWICNLLEEKEKQLHLENSTIEFPIKPYEIITIRIQNE